ncbi:gliding motility lipoprotein GldD [Prolixibacteraceae bacterium JC049]|nr:gliding motility lipoprotein GldD [Prolixibacteraceae bacterium JC049]
MRWIVLCVASFMVLLGCKENYTPKPRGYFRIGFPEKEYNRLHGDWPYSFDIATYSKAVENKGALAQKNEINIVVPANRAKIHISYKELDNNLGKLTEECRTLAYKHSVKASSIEEKVFVNPDKKVYGTIYKIRGNAASPYQFYLTDSTKHFLRGALYIKEVPNYDSLRPVITFLEKDVVRLIESTSWK